jgi:hypothetical protein
VSNITELREKIRGWGIYGPIVNSEGNVTMYAWRALDVDALSDEQIVEVAKDIADNKPVGNAYPMLPPQ